MLVPVGLAGSGTAVPAGVHTLHDSTGCQRKRPMHRGNASWIRSRTCSPRTTHFILRQPGASRQVSWHQDSSTGRCRPARPSPWGWRSPTPTPATAPCASSRARLDAELGNGIDALGGSGALTPYADFALADAGARTWRLGWRATRGSDATGGLEGTRREPAGVGCPSTPLTLRRGALGGAAVTAAANTGLARAWLAWCFLEQNPPTVPPRRSGPTRRCLMPRLRRRGAAPGGTGRDAGAGTRIRAVARRGSYIQERGTEHVEGFGGAAVEQGDAQCSSNSGSAPGSQGASQSPARTPAQGCDPICGRWRPPHVPGLGRRWSEFPTIWGTPSHAPHSLARTHRECLRIVRTDGMAIQ